MWGKANVFFFALLGMLLWPVVDSLGPSVEGRLWPVTERTELTAVEPAGELKADVTGTSIKLRNCDFVEVRWLYGRPEEPSSRVVIDFMDQPRPRPEGSFTFGPWRVGMPADQVRTKSWVVAVHKCHPLWNTETLFWVGAAERLPS